MAKKQKNGTDSGRNTTAVRMLIGSIAIALIAVVFIIFSRGYINCASRMDFIARRLEAYPRMRKNHQSELDRMEMLWMTSDYNSFARQAAFLYDRSDTQSDEAEKLRRISEMLGVTKISVIPADGQESTAEAAEDRNPDTAYAPWRTAASSRLKSRAIRNSGIFVPCGTPTSWIRSKPVCPAT